MVRKKIPDDSTGETPAILDCHRAKAHCWPGSGGAMARADPHGRLGVSEASWCAASDPSAGERMKQQALAGRRRPRRHGITTLQRQRACLPWWRSALARYHTCTLLLLEGKSKARLATHRSPTPVITSG